MERDTERGRTAPPKELYPMVNWKYDIFLWVIGIVIDLFFREVVPRGSWKVPREGPVLFVAAPHANQVSSSPQPLLFPLGPIFMIAPSDIPPRRSSSHGPVHVANKWVISALLVCRCYNTPANPATRGQPTCLPTHRTKVCPWLRRLELPTGRVRSRRPSPGLG